MEFKSIFDPNLLLHIFLLENIKNTDSLKALASQDNIAILNPEYILGFTHLSISIEKSATSKRRKLDKPISKDLIQYTLDNSKHEYCIDLHNIFKEGSNTKNCFLIFCNNKNVPSESEIEKSLDCISLGVEDYSKYTNFEKIRKEFSITETEINNETGIIGAVYNKLSLKDLK